MNIWLAIFLGGGIGSVARFGITRIFLLIGTRGAFPWATLASNVLATALLAYLMFRFQPELQDRHTARAFLAVGFCGGFSTFSTFSYENFLLIREGMPAFAIANVMVSVFVCLFFFYLAARSV